MHKRKRGHRKWCPLFLSAYKVKEILMKNGTKIKDLRNEIWYDGLEWIF